MSAALTAQLRANREPIALAPAAGGTITIRVQVAEMWEAVRVIASPDTAVSLVKQRVLAEFYPDAQFQDDFVLKLRGWEILDERQSLAAAGIQNGSIILLAHRRRRPVR